MTAEQVKLARLERDQKIKAVFVELLYEALGEHSDVVAELMAERLLVGLYRRRVYVGDIDLIVQGIRNEADLREEQQRSRAWRKLAGRYDDIRDWLRLCRDNQEGHSEFYRHCCLTIFGFYGDEDEAEAYADVEDD